MLAQREDMRIMGETGYAPLESIIDKSIQLRIDFKKADFYLFQNKKTKEDKNCDSSLVEPD